MNRPHLKPRDEPLSHAGMAALKDHTENLIREHVIEIIRLREALQCELNKRDVLHNH